MAHVMSGSDVWAYVLGWIWSVHGLSLVLACVIGGASGVAQIVAALSVREVTLADPVQAAQASPGTIVTLSARIAPGEVCDFAPRATTGSFSLAVLDGTGRRVLVLRPGLLSRAEQAGGAAETYRGKVLRVDAGPLGSGGHQVDPRRAFRAIGIDLPADAVVVADGDHDQLPWWAWALTAVLLSGAGFTIRRVVQAVRCIRDRNHLFGLIDERQRHMNDR